MIIQCRYAPMCPAWFALRLRYKVLFVSGFKRNSLQVVGGTDTEGAFIWWSLFNSLHVRACKHRILKNFNGAAKRMRDHRKHKNH